jgi:hypothetical protein
MATNIDANIDIKRIVECRNRDKWQKIGIYAIIYRMPQKLVNW